MSFTIEIPFIKDLGASKDIDAVGQCFKDPAAFIRANFPGLHSIAEIKKGHYKWVFEKLSYGGSEMVIEWITSFHQTDQTFEIRPENPSGHKLFSNWRFAKQAAGQGTVIHIEMTVVLDIPLPSLMKSIVQPLAQKEITKLIEKFTTNVGKALA